MDVLFFFVPVALVAAGYLKPELASRRQPLLPEPHGTFAAGSGCASC